MSKFKDYRKFIDGLMRSQIGSDLSQITKNLPTAIRTQIEDYVADPNINIGDTLTNYFSLLGLEHLNSYLTHVRAHVHEISKQVIVDGKEQLLQTLSKIPPSYLIRLGITDLIEYCKATSFAQSEEACILYNDQAKAYQQLIDFRNYFDFFKSSANSIAGWPANAMTQGTTIKLPLTQMKKIGDENSKVDAPKESVLQYLTDTNNALTMIKTNFELSQPNKRSQLFHQLFANPINPKANTETINQHHQQMLSLLQQNQFTDRSEMSQTMRQAYNFIEVIILPLLVIRIAINMIQTGQRYGFKHCDKFQLYGTNSQRKAKQAEYDLTLFAKPISEKPNMPDNSLELQPVVSCYA